MEFFKKYLVVFLLLMHWSTCFAKDQASPEEKKVGLSCAALTSPEDDLILMEQRAKESISGEMTEGEIQLNGPLPKLPYKLPLHKLEIGGSSKSEWTPIDIELLYDPTIEGE